jgi:hypothetical protein
MVARVKEKGEKALSHQAIGRPSNHQLANGCKDEAVRLFKDVYKDMDPTLAAETMAERDGILINHETLRRELIRQGLWEANSPVSRQHRRWRERKPCRGELVQIDTSVHPWFGPGFPSSNLIAMIDDSSSAVFA